jgi:TonB-dependent SusC/RagA subfamily outer membrane receptor
MIRRRVVTAGSIIAASLMLAAPIAAQTGVLSGVIYDQTNKVGLGGAEVRVKGTDLVAISGKDGRFTIANIPVSTLEIETVRSGYRPYRLPLVKIAAGDTSHVYLALATLPEERASTDAGIEVAAEDFKGKFSVMASEIKLKFGELSENAPLYVIDGVVLSGNKVPDLDSEKILSVEVVKGAAAQSLYGERGSNGVIHITTRKVPN